MSDPPTPVLIFLTIGDQTDIPALVNQRGYNLLFALAERQDRALTLAYANPDRAPMYRPDQMTSHMSRFLRMIAIRARKQTIGLPTMRGDMVFPGPNWKLLLNGLLVTLQQGDRMVIFLEPRHRNFFEPAPKKGKGSTMYARLGKSELTDDPNSP